MPLPGPGPRGWRPTVRSVALPVMFAAAAVFLALTVNRHYPLRHWLFFVYVRLWVYTALFAVPALAAGWRLARLLVPDTPLVGERVVIASALGTLTFAWGVFLCGIAGILSGPTFFLLPAALLAIGGRDTYRSWRRIFQRLRPMGVKLFLPGTALATGAAVFLGLGCLAMYLQVINPLNLGGDPHWYHLPIAERYAAAGRIAPFAEGWYLGTYPQLASLLYTWAFLAPGQLFDHTQLSSHLEWILVLATVGGIAVLVRRILGGARAPFAAAALFLFPQIFAYDSSLITAADHVLAFWGPPLALTLLRLTDRFDTRHAATAGLITAGAMSTKYQGSYFAAALFVTLVVLAIRRRRLAPALIAPAVCLIATSSHWLKNLIFYGDPLYPLLHRHLPSRPFHEGAALLLEREYFNPLFTPTGTLGTRLVEALKAMFTFAFIPHDFSNFHGTRPIFGPLFTLLLPAVLLFRAHRRLWWVVGWTQLGVAVWFLTSHEDRFLQALVPWMAAATAAVLALSWRSLRWGRMALVALVGLQIVDSADVYFLRSHSMIGDSAVRSTAAYLAEGAAGRYGDRFRIWGSGQDVARELPPAATVLLHRVDHLGIGAVTVTDDAGWQGGIDYVGLDTPASVSALWRSFAVTHLTWYPDNPPDSLDGWAREAVFIRARGAVRTEIKSIGRYRLTAMAAQPSGQGLTEPTTIAWLGCKNDAPTALYSARGLATGHPTTLLGSEALEKEPGKVLETAQVLIVRKECKRARATDDEIASSFEVASESRDMTAYARRASPGGSEAKR